MEQRPVEARVMHDSPFLESNAKLESHLAEARARRARVVAEIVMAAGPAMDPLLRALGTRLARWRRRRQTRDALKRCSDRVLADIGIEREDIPLIAKGIDPGEYHGSVPRGWWRMLGDRIDAAGRAWREQRRIYRELMAYRDDELDDLGIRRSDISAIARARLPAPA
jgi:uncharacterized protein YjiS (DUF1127 family)